MFQIVADIKVHAIDNALMALPKVEDRMALPLIDVYIYIPTYLPAYLPILVLNGTLTEDIRRITSTWYFKS